MQQIYPVMLPSDPQHDPSQVGGLAAVNQRAVPAALASLIVFVFVSSSESDVSTLARPAEAKAPSIHPPQELHLPA